MEALLSEAHPLVGETEVQREEQADGRGQARHDPEQQPDAHDDLADRLEGGEQLGMGKHRRLQKVSIPSDRVTGGELRHAPWMERDEARRHHRVGDHAGHDPVADLGPDRLDEPRANDDTKQRNRTVGVIHARWRC